MTVAAALGIGAPVALADGLAGSYLAAGHANYKSDYKQAAHYFTQAVLNDPTNPVLLQNALVNKIIAGELASAVPLAVSLSQIVEDAQLADLVLVTDALHNKEFDRALEILSQEEQRLNPLMAGLLRGWVAAGQGDTTGAAEYFDKLGKDTSFGPLGRYHKALVYGLAGNFDGAAEIMDGDADGPLRVNRASIYAHIQVLMQLDRRDDALALIDAELPARRSENLIALREKITNGDSVPFDYVNAPLDGAAEVFLTLATALNQEDAARFALMYGRFAQHVRPDYNDAHLLTADLLDSQGQYELAIADYDRIPEDAAVYRSAAVGRADALAASGQIDVAVSALQELKATYPQDRFVRIALADLLRGEERYDEAREAYTGAIAMIDTEVPSDWRTYYVRGIANERTDNWEDAEADFRKALELAPDQPLVLNYLGYSLVEKNLKIDEAKNMIERAVEARPDDGYITDSLGWVLYKLGEYEEAVPYMERAAELVPIDPIINDHLGDVYWSVGRKIEAEFQWRRALSFDPEEKDAERIRLKLELGLDEVLAREAERETTSN